MTRDLIQQPWTGFSGLSANAQRSKVPLQFGIKVPQFAFFKTTAEPITFRPPLQALNIVVVISHPCLGFHHRELLPFLRGFICSTNTWQLPRLPQLHQQEMGHAVQTDLWLSLAAGLKRVLHLSCSFCWAVAADAPELISVSSPMAANAPVRMDAVCVSVPVQAVPITVLQPHFVRADN